MGQLVIVILAITLFLSTNPVVGILGFLAAYEFIRRASRVTGVYGIETFSPTEQKKQEIMKAMNPPPEKTLEEELVDNLVPISPNDEVGLSDGGSFQPVLGPLYGAVEPDYQGVI
jgi:transcription antitermination factor NusG